MSDVSYKTTRNSGFIAQAAAEWPTWAAILLCYAAWFLLGGLLYPAHPLPALAGMAVAVAFHSSLQHEAIHGHPTPSALCNELLVGLPLGLAYPYRRYRTTHLRHHRDETLTDPHGDPESYYWDREAWSRLGRARRLLLTANNTVLGRLLLGPLVGSLRFFVHDLRRIGAGDGTIGAAWAIHALSVLAVAAIVTRGFHMPFWLYALGPAYAGNALIGLRSYCEHQWHDAPDGRTIIVEGSWLSLLFLYNNLHVVHHARPAEPWFRMPRLYAQDRETWQARNRGYVYRGYRTIIRRHFLRPKEPLLHPPAGSRP
ncbi:fatty acid desaturase [Gluconacetobacter takamatsuzukensis]|uniref:Fatty acid desaturase n=1 Tax=Gluconacetobacter takamatsuzukensis TaxID=1286190 RepID=A0A7W4KEL0_9PROT|nr:fatty acid desaturase [Gluconacetobacter takamatsuzukensis]MBB2205460.1 fatty acid desaturase [Gluconacetobacter takamatsuzukensis]